MLTVLRTVVDVQKVFSFTSQNALIVRAEADTMALVEKLIADLDKPRPEVIIDVMVMEVNTHAHAEYHGRFCADRHHDERDFRAAAGDYDAGYPDVHRRDRSTTTTTTGTTATTTTPTTTTHRPAYPTSTNIPLNQLGHISSADFSLTNLPGAALEAVLNDSSTRVLQAPQIRAVDNQKATLKIGEKVPTASGSFQPGVAGVGVSPLVNTQFTYLDVGVNLEVLPRCMRTTKSRCTSIWIFRRWTVIRIWAASRSREIGQNKETADVRLREGEVNLIGGIIQQTDTQDQDRHPRPREHSVARTPLQRRRSAEQTGTNW